VLDQPQVFRANVSGPWIFPDSASAEAIVQVAHACPSGAITYERADGGPQESVPAVNVVRVRENGPLAVRADLEIAGARAIRATLCRCGASKNKPYCDGSHTAAGFTATGEPPTQPSEALQQRNGPVIVKPIVNGPLEVSGNLELCSATGRTTNRAQKSFLCRCGQSGNKPYCDGTHKKTGFQAEGSSKS
jgi:CDGSH-type Zn-finger protein